MKIDYKLVWAITIIIALVYFVFKGRSDNKDTEKLLDNIEAKIHMIGVQKEALKRQNATLSERNVLYLDSIIHMNARYKESEQRRVGAIKYYEKRLHNVDGLTADEHNEFFSGRYSSDSTEVRND